MEEKNIRTNVTLSKEVYERIKTESKKMGLSMSGYMNVACIEYLKESSFIDFSEIITELKEIAKKQEKLSRRR